MPVIHFAQRLNNKLLCFLTMLLELMTFGVTVVSDPLRGEEQWMESVAASLGKTSNRTSPAAAVSTYGVSSTPEQRHNPTEY